jgi:hypothetical protein
MTDSPHYQELPDEDTGDDDHTPYRDSDGVWCCQRHEDRHGDEAGW